MNNEELLERMAPCGLHCGTCVAFADGPVRAHALALRELLGPNFAAYAERFAGMNPVFAGYDDFAALLDWLANGGCSGCRGAGCLFTACKVGHCVREQGVDFCFQCSAFPCERHGMPSALAERWKVNNERMRSVGVERYYEVLKTKPRYP
ncbi:MAG: DUF3795 domain-containing protein [Desulfovibrio sp.]